MPSMTPKPASLPPLPRDGGSYILSEDGKAWLPRSTDSTNLPAAEASPDADLHQKKPADVRA